MKDKLERNKRRKSETKKEKKKVRIAQGLRAPMPIYTERGVTGNRVQRRSN